jgi:hypothetical protein
MHAKPLPFGKNQGASLRIGGKPQRSAALGGTTDWEPLQMDFEVIGPQEEITLVCEFRASAGQAWFARDSLLLRRLD